MAKRPDKTPAGIEELISYIGENRGFDFSGYKRSSLQRRIKRRMSDVKIQTFAQYRDFLEANPDEFNALLNTILINVTGFYRDPDAWRYLETEVIPAVVQTAQQQQRPVKAWSVGCASGEEAYTIAMLLAHAMGAERYRTELKVYATDVDEEALQQARRGIYAAKSVEDLPKHLRENYMVESPEGWSIRRDLRQCVIFGRHNIVEDPVISNVDLLVCRNLLIYLDSSTQQSILPRLHYALSGNGVLFLGKAETLLAYSDRFRPISGKYRLFQKMQTPSALLAPLVSTEAANPVQLPSEGLLQHLFASMIDGLEDAHVILNKDMELVYYNRRAEEWFALDAEDLDRPVQELELSFRPADLRPLLNEAATQRRQVAHERCEFFSQQGEPLALRITVRPLQDSAGRPAGMAVTYRDICDVDRLERSLVECNENLETTTEELQSSNEELETTNEELQSTNEELETTNEELQSTNEELETTNEELRSTNEAMETTNEELRERSDELVEYQITMDRLLGSIQFGIIVLDAEGRVVLTNHEIESVWGLAPEDAEGKNVFRLNIGAFKGDAQKKIAPVIAGARRFAKVETDLMDHHGTHLRCRIAASRISDEGTAGGSIIFIENISHLKELEDSVMEGRKLVEAIIKTARGPLLVLDHRLAVVETNAAYSRAFATTEKETLGRPFHELSGGQWDIPAMNDLLGRVVLRDVAVRNFETVIENPRLGALAVIVNARRLGKNRATDTLIVLSMECRPAALNSGGRSRARKA